MAPSSRVTAAFEKDEKCLCFHGSFMYEAKILEVQQADPGDRKKGFEYRVHYKGWKNTWDDWVPENRLRKPTEENKELAAELLKELKNQQREERDQKAAAKKSGSAKRKGQGANETPGTARRDGENGTTQSAMRGTKRNRDSDLEKEDAFNSTPAIKIHTSDKIKSLLVDDWEHMTKTMLLLSLPHSYPISKIMSAYREYEAPKRRPGSADADLLEEFIYGLLDYFNGCLGKILLYRYERPQWLELYNLMHRGAEAQNASSAIINPNPDKAMDLAGKSASDIYGVEHLCRLIVKMPELIAKTNMDHPSVIRLRYEFNKLTKWMSKNIDQLFIQQYFDPGDDYKERARGDYD